jgi:hypothetical protein
MDRAYTQYTDLTGTAAADLHPQARFRGLAQAVGIDPDRYAIVGLRLWGAPPKITALYAIDLQGLPQMDHEALMEFIRDSPEAVHLKRLDLPENAELEAHCKQFEAILTVKGLDLSEVEISN